MKKKLKLTQLKVQSLVTNDGWKTLPGGLHSGMLTCAGGFTCEDIAGCGGVYTVWHEKFGNQCGDSLDCPRHDL